MAGKSDTPTQNLAVGKGQGLPMSPTVKAGSYFGGISVPAISQPLKGQLYGWLPLSNAYGILYCETRLKPNCPHAIAHPVTQHQSNA